MFTCSQTYPTDLNQTGYVTLLLWTRLISEFGLFQTSFITNQSGPGSVVGIATGYGLDGPGSNPGVGEIFRTCPDGPWGPPNLLYNWYRVFPGGKERPGRDADPSPPSSAVGHERVELYLYSHYGAYGLYRASVPVQGCTLPLPSRARTPSVCPSVYTGWVSQ
jgi:hypothetical protein